MKEIKKSSTVQEIFISKVDNIKISEDNFIERNTFKLVCDYLNNEFSANDDDFNDKILADKVYEGEKLGYDSKKYLINKIKLGIDDLKNADKKDIEDLTHKWLELKAAYYDYLCIRSSRTKNINELHMNNLNLADMTKKEKKQYDKKLDRIEKEYRDLIEEADSIVVFSIIELCAALNIPLGLISNTNIRTYCDAVLFDVNNDKYERLSFVKHINSDGSVSNYKHK